MEQIAINILPKGAKPVCHSSQFDEGRQIMFNLFNDATPYTLSGTETISVLVHKPDGAEVVDNVTNTSDSYVIWDVSADACELSGVCECELSIVENGILLGSKNFTMKVEEDAYGGRNIEVRTASGRIATFNTNMVEAFKSLKSEINPVQDLHGYSKPWSGGGGKNKLPNVYTTKTINGVTFTVNDDGSVKVNGTASNAALFTLAILGDILTNGQSYYINGNASDNKAFLQLQTSQYGGVANVGSDYNLVYSTSGEAQILVIRVNSGQTANNITINPMIRLPNTSADFEPYSNICPISGFNALSVTRTGVNLWDEVWELGNYDVLTGRKAVNNNNIRCKNPIPCKPNTQFYFKCSTNSGILFYDQNGTYINYIIGNNRVITTPSNAWFICFYVTSGYGTTYNNDISINYPSSDTEYHSYNGQTATVNFGQTVYGGQVDVTRGKVTKEKGFITCNGSENWQVSGSGAGQVFYLLLSDMKSGLDLNGISNYIPTGKGTSFCIRFGYNSPYVFIYQAVNALGVSDLASFKNYLSNNPLELCYPLATPIEISTTPEYLSALSGQTNNVYGDTNGDTEVEYYIEV